MKIINDPITVLLRAGEETPRLVEWRGGTYSVLSLLDDWFVKTKWWAREVARHYMVLSTDQFVMEIYQQGREWTLARIYG
jgi:hypothetical protein